MVLIQKYIRINERIRVPEVRVIGPEAEQLGVMMLQRALDLAKEHSLDLVEVAPTAKPPVCRIMDFSKYKYDQEKKEKIKHGRERRHSSRKNHLRDKSSLCKKKETKRQWSNRNNISRRTRNNL